MVRTHPPSLPLSKNPKDSILFFSSSFGLVLLLSPHNVLSFSPSSSVTAPPLALPFTFEKLNAEEQSYLHSLAHFGTKNRYLAVYKTKV